MASNEPSPTAKIENQVRQESSRPVQNPKQVKEKNHTWVWWTVGAVTIAGTGAAIYYLSQPENDKTTQVTRIEPGSP